MKNLSQRGVRFSEPQTPSAPGPQVASASLTLLKHGKNTRIKRELRIWRYAKYDIDSS